MPLNLPGFRLPGMDVFDDQFNELLLKGFPRAARPSTAKFPGLPEDEEESVKDQLLRYGASGLGALGNALDKIGARQIRGGLAGKPRELLSFIPFSDSLGITDYNDSTSGKDLLHSYGLIDKDTTPGGGLAGFAAEMALDPLNWVSLGGKGALTQAAKKAGTYKKWSERIRGSDVAESAIRSHVRDRFLPAGASGPLSQADDALFNSIKSRIESGYKASGHTVLPEASEQALRATGYTGDVLGPASSLFNVHTPWLPGIGSKTIYAGPRGSRAVKYAKGLESIGDKIKYAPGVRNARALFAAETAGTVDPRVQRVAEADFSRIRDELLARGRSNEVELRTLLEPHLKGLNSHQIEEIIRYARERAEQVPEAMDPLRHSAVASALTPDAADAVAKIADRIRATGEQVLSEAQRMGSPVRDASNIHAQYAGRTLAKVPESKGASSSKFSKVLATIVPPFRRRKDPLVNVPGGSIQIEDLVHDPRVSTWRRTITDPVAAQRYIHDVLSARETGRITPQVADTLIRNVPPNMLRRVVQHRMPYFLDALKNPGPARSPGALVRKNQEAYRRILTGNIDPDLESLPGFAQLFPGLIGKNMTEYQRVLTPFRAAPSDVLGAIRRLPTRKRFAFLKNAPESADLVKRSQQLQGYLEGLHPENLDGRFWNPDIIADAASRERYHAQAQAANEVMLKSLSQYARPVSEFRADLQRSITVPDALREVGLTGNYGRGADKYGALVSIAERLGIPLPPKASYRKIEKVLAQHAVDRPLVEELQGLNKRWVTPREIDTVNRFGDWRDQFAPKAILDNFNNLFRAGAYVPFLASHSRNLSTGIFNSALSGAHDPTRFGPMKYIGPFLEALSLNRGKGLHRATGIAEVDSISDPIARGQAFMNHLYAQGVAYRPEIVNDLVSPATFTPAREFAHLPGNQQTFTEAVKGAFRNGRASFTPWEVAGFGGRERDLFAPVAIGRRIGGDVENIIRPGQYLAALRSGHSPEVARQLVNKFQFDYSNLSQFEKEWMRRLVPFYTFSRKNLPLQLSLLKDNPAAINTQLRAINASKGDEYTPAYLGGGVAARIGQQQGNNQLFLSSLGLPIEDALERFRFKGELPDLLGTMERSGAMLTPLVKFPLEQASDRQFHTGRNLSDLKPTGIGSGFGLLNEDRAQLLTNLVSNSPLARVGTTFDRIVDPRKDLITKALNLGTGVKLSTVDLERAKAIEARRALEKALESAPGVADFSEFYVPPDQMANLSPETIKLMRLFTTMKAEARKAAEAKRQIGVKTGG